MRANLPIRSLLLLVLVAASGAQAKDKYDEPLLRPIMLSEHPADGTHSVYVKGQVVTTLRFEQPVDPTKTKMLGWEGRLEPLVVVRRLFLGSREPSRSWRTRAPSSMRGSSWT
jgi:hypothetical protein